ncbi:MAG: hypothetical protein ACOX2F_05900 [bacterium]
MSRQIDVEYRKLSSFLNDYLRFMGRGWLFLVIKNRIYDIGDKIDFNIKVAGIKRDFYALGEVVYKGVNDKGKNGIGLKFSFDDESSKALSAELKTLTIDKYGEFWGGKICSLMEGVNHGQP